MDLIPVKGYISAVEAGVWFISNPENWVKAREFWWCGHYQISADWKKGYGNLLNSIWMRLIWKTLQKLGRIVERHHTDLPLEIFQKRERIVLHECIKILIEQWNTLTCFLNLWAQFYVLKNCSCLEMSSVSEMGLGKFFRFRSNNEFVGIQYT